MPFEEGLNVSPTVAPGTRVNPNQPLSAFGGGPTLEAAGEAAQGVAKTAGDIFSKEKEFADDAAVMKGHADAQNKATQLTVNYSKLGGEEALAQYPKYKADMEATLESTQNGMRSPTASRMFNQVKTQISDSFNSDMQKTLAEKAEGYYINSATATASSFNSASAADPTNQDKLNKAINAAGATAARVNEVDHTKQFAVGSDAYNELVKTFKSTTYETTIKALMDGWDFKTASQIFEKGKAAGDLTAKMIDEVGGQLKTGLYEQKFNDSYNNNLSKMIDVNGNPDDKKRMDFLKKEFTDPLEFSKAWHDMRNRDYFESASNGRAVKAQETDFQQQVESLMSSKEWQSMTGVQKIDAGMQMATKNGKNAGEVEKFKSVFLGMAAPKPSGKNITFNRLGGSIIDGTYGDGSAADKAFTSGEITWEQKKSLTNTNLEFNFGEGGHRVGGNLTPREDFGRLLTNLNIDTSDPGKTGEIWWEYGRELEAEAKKVGATSVSKLTNEEKDNAKSAFAKQYAQENSGFNAEKYKTIIDKWEKEKNPLPLGSTDKIGDFLKTNKVADTPGKRQYLKDHPELMNK